MQQIDARTPRRLLLVVEDDAEMRRLLVQTLHAEGYGVLDFESGDALLSSWPRGGFPREPAVIIVDVHLPGQSGLALVSELRGRGLTTPVVFITAFVSEETLNQAFRLGASVVLSKPFDMIELRRVVGCFVPLADYLSERPRDPASSE